MRKILLSLAVVLVLAGAVGWTYWTGTPQYALQQIGSAVQDADTERLHARVDVARLSKSTVDGFLDPMLEELRAGVNSDDGFEALGSAFGAQMVEGLRPMATEAVESYLTTAFEGRTETEGEALTESEELSQIFGPLQAMAQHTKVAGLDGVETAGEKATASIRIEHTDLDTTFVLQLEMEKGDGWQVVGVVEPASYVEKVVSTQELRLRQANEPILSRLGELFPTGEPSASLFYRSGMFSRTEHLRFGVPVTNMTDHPLTELKLVVEQGDDRVWFEPANLNIQPSESGTVAGQMRYRRSNDLLRTLQEEEFDKVRVFVERAVLSTPEGPDTIAPYPDWTSYLSDTGGAR